MPMEGRPSNTSGRRKRAREGCAGYILIGIIPIVNAFTAVPTLPVGISTRTSLHQGVHNKESYSSSNSFLHPSSPRGKRVSMKMADPWDLTGQREENNTMFNNPNRNESKMSEATATLRRDFKKQMAESQALPGFLRGALDPLRLKRNVEQSRVAYLSRMLQADDATPISAAAADADEEARAQSVNVPTSLDEVLIQAQTDFAAAAAMGVKRLRVEILTPGLNEQIESRFPFDAGMLVECALRLSAAIAPLKTTLLMDSPGTAAMAHAIYEREYGGELCPHVTFAALSKQRSMRDKLYEADDAGEDHAQVYLVVRPKSVRGDQVLLTIENAVSKAPEACWVLLNPLLEDTIDAYTFGIGETDRRRAVVAAFEEAYCYRGLYKISRPALIPSERGAVVKRLGAPWKVFKLAKEGYSLLRSFDEKPTRSQVSSLPW